MFLALFRTGCYTASLLFRLDFIDFFARSPCQDRKDPLLYMARFFGELSPKRSLAPVTPAPASEKLFFRMPRIICLEGRPPHGSEWKIKGRYPGDQGK
jgi:hypothetical protein